MTPQADHGALPGWPYLVGQRFSAWLGEAGQSVREARRTGLALIALFVVVRLVRVHGPGGFVVAGSQFVHPGAPGELRLTYSGGYDGQFVYRLALAPFTQRVTDFGITLDAPGYRQQRIATALFAHVAAWLPGIGVALALILVNAVAVAVAMFAGTRIAVDAGRNAYWGLVLAVPACLPISLGRDLTEPVAWAAILVALVLVRRDRWPLAALTLTVAALARETSLLVVLGFGAAAAWQLVRGRGRRWPVLWLLVPVGVEFAWQGWLASVWGSAPIRTGQNNTSVPVVGVLYSIVVPGSAGGSVALDAVYTVERIATLALIVGAGWLVWRRRTTASTGEVVSWAIAALLALSVRNWKSDVQFLRATYEAWGLSVLVLLHSTQRRDRALLGGAAVVSAGVGLMYVARV
ncbi:MAG TPA: hypothetical protein VGL39_10335 [Jatrophihabitantaceae bacterium]|jgi:hypothetical protein